MKKENKSQKNLIDSIENIALEQPPKGNKSFKEKYFWFIIIFVIVGFFVVEKYLIPFMQSPETMDLKRNFSYFKVNKNSKFHENDFYNNLINKYSSRWYIHGRILELIHEKALPHSLENKLKKLKEIRIKKIGEIFTFTSLGQIPLIKEREPGLFAIWECTINSKKQGHIGFVES